MQLLRLGFERAFVRFPAIVMLAIAACALSCLLSAGVFGEGYLFDPDGNSDAYRLASTTVTALLLAMLPSAVAVLACERADEARPCDEGRPPLVQSSRTSLVAQVAVAAACVAAFLVGDVVCRAVDRVTLLYLMAFGVNAICACAACWLLMSKDNEDELMPRLVRAAAFTGFLVGALNGGLFIVILAAELLVGFSWSPIYAISAAFCWELFAPCALCAQLPRRDDRLGSPRAYVTFVGLIVFPLCLLLLGVLYLYIARIVIAWDMPSGEMNWFGSFALLVYVCLWLGMRMVAHRAARWFVRWGWALLVPVVAVQLVGIYIRLAAYGLTALRYASLACLAVGVGALVLGALDASPRKLFPLAAAAAFVACLSPLNVLDVANYAQAARLTSALKQSGMLDAEGLMVPATPDAQPEPDAHDQIVDSWSYLRYASLGYFEPPVMADLRMRAQDRSTAELFGFADERESWAERVDEEAYDWWYVAFEAKSDGLDVSGMRRIYPLDAASSANVYEVRPEDGYELSCTWDDGTSLSASLAPLVERLIAGHPGLLDTAPQDMRRHKLVVSGDDLRLELDDGRVLALSYASLSVELDNDVPEITSVEVMGYLLVP